MPFEHCAACPSRGACSETIPPDGFTAPISMNGPDKPGMCWNAYTNVLRYDEQRKAAKAVAINDPALAQHPVAQANAASWPTGKPAKAPSSPAKAPSAPGAGTVTQRIFAACDTVLSGLPQPHDKATLEQARKLAIPVLEAAGINGNSARKGSSMWVAARQ